jgi:mannosyltransferase
MLRRPHRLAGRPRTWTRNILRTAEPNRSPAALPDGVHRLEWIALGAILLVAAAARFYRLNTSLWYDEIDTLVNFVRLPTRELITSFGSTNNHMFYSLEAQAAIALFSESAWALRLPAVLFGLGSLVVLWAIARRAVGRMEALVTVLLLAISYHHVWFSQNARGYTGLMFWVACATLLFAQGIARPTWRTWSLYALCVAAANYTHLSALFFFVGHGVVYLALLFLSRGGRAAAAQRVEISGARTMKPIVGFLLGGALTLLLYAPILWQVVHTVHAQAAGSVDPAQGPGEWLNPLRALREVSASLSSAGPLVPLILFASVVAFAVGAVSLARRAPVVTAVYLLHIPITVAILLALHSRIWPRYFFVDVGFIYLGVVHGTFLLCAYVSTRFGMDRRWPHAAKVVTAAAVVAMSAGSLFLLARNYAYPKQDFAGAVAYVERERQPGDAVTSLGVARLGFRGLYAPQWAAVDSVAELDGLRASSSATWVVIAFPGQNYGAKAQFASLLETDFDRMAVFPGTLANGAIWVYRSHPK